jgi:extracellular elastinolytic metalloproteinase
MFAGGATCALAAEQNAPRDRRTVALEYVRTHAADLGVTAADLDDVVVTSDTTSSSGAAHVYLRQRYRGIAIWDADLTVTIATDGRVLGHSGQFFARLAAAGLRVTTKLTALEAVAAAMTHLELTPVQPMRVVREPKGAAREGLLSDGGIAADPIKVELVFYPSNPPTMRLAWIVEIEERSGDHWWVALVDANTGALLHKLDRVNALSAP